MSMTAPTHHIHSFKSFIHFIHCIHSCLPHFLAIQDLPAEVAPAEEAQPLAPQPQPQAGAAGAAILPTETGFVRLRVIEKSIHMHGQAPGAPPGGPTNGLSKGHTGFDLSHSNPEGRC